MDSRDLDRLMSQTELNPLAKQALRHVRKAIAEGDVEGFSINRNSWSVKVGNPKGLACTWTFYLRKPNGNNKN